MADTPQVPMRCVVCGKVLLVEPGVLELPRHARQDSPALECTGTMGTLIGA
jgi:hypothetical protein